MELRRLLENNPGLKELNLPSVNLAGADLNNLILKGFDLSWSNLSCSFLINADLTNANLAHAKLTGADLTGANLTGVNLWSANLQWATLTDSNLTDVNLRFAIGNGSEIISVRARSQAVVICIPTKVAAIVNEQRLISEWLNPESDVRINSSHLWAPSLQPIFEECLGMAES